MRRNRESAVTGQKRSLPDWQAQAFQLLFSHHVTAVNGAADATPLAPVINARIHLCRFVKVEHQFTTMARRPALMVRQFIVFST